MRVVLILSTCHWRLTSIFVRLYLTFVCPCIANIISNYNQQDATFLDLFTSTDALHVSGGSSAHHQEHITVHTASGSQPILLLAWTRWKSMEFYFIHDSSKQQYRLTIPEAVCTVMCSWWWTEEQPETWTASVEINQSRNVAFCWLKFRIVRLPSTASQLTQ